MGPVSAENSLILSRNVPAVFLAGQLKDPNFHEFLLNIYPHRLRRENNYGSSLVLGGVEYTMLEIVQLYSMLANRGNFQKASWFPESKEEVKENMIAPEAVAMVMNILGKNKRPGYSKKRNYMIKDLEVYWKTGTSFGFRDAWTVGIFGPYVLAVWVGNFSGPGHPEFVGAKTAAPLFFEIVDKLKDNIPKNYFEMHGYHSKLADVEVCPLSGKLPGPHCPHKVMSLFLPGVSSIKKCDIHRKIRISQVTGKRACLETKGKVLDKVVEIWPSNILNIFEKVGLPRKDPPTFGPECKRSSIALQGSPPSIITPRRGLKYTFRMNQKENLLALKAKADADVGSLHWYIEDEYLGKKKPSETLYWNARPGKYMIRAIDDFGRQANRKLTVLFLPK